MKRLNNYHLPVICFVFIVVIISLFSAVVPPMQSPDETAHFARAHMLSRGILKLSSNNGTSSGGQVDTALSAYMSHFGYLDEDANRVLSKTLNVAKEIAWSDKTTFIAAPGTGYYFPVLYAPYVLGLWVGESTNLTIHNSYLLAKFICTLCIALCIVISARLFPFNPLLMYLLVLPTSIFQYASMNLDGIVTAFSLLACAIFARFAILRDERNVLKNMFFILLSILVSCKLHLFPMYLMAIFVCVRTKKKEDYYKFALSLALVLIWIVTAVLNNVDTRIDLGISSVKIAEYYITNPMKFIDVLGNTFKYPDMVMGYVYYLVSITPLRNSTYHLLAQAMLVLGLCSLSFKSIRINFNVHTIFFVCAVATMLAVFFLLLVTWNPHPAPFIWGVQGRYFWIPMILFSYALSGSVNWKDGVAGKLIGVILVVFSLVALQAEMLALINRYYIMN